MSSSRYRIVSDTYHDSVQLMRIASDVAESLPVIDAQAVMGTPANRQTLLDAGHLTATELEGVDTDDLLLVARADEAADAEAAVEEMTRELSRGGKRESSGGQEIRPKSIRRATADSENAGIALISVPGEYAAMEAWNALHDGLEVHIFSDNVSLANERKLKAHASKRNRLVMGPDCGSAIVDGLPLGFVNEVRDGSIGIVSASGTGLQAVTSRISRRGGGISQAIGTGGRDLSDEVGGLTTQTALTHLDADETTSVVVLLSKPPGESALKKIRPVIEGCTTPIVTLFQGVEPELPGVYTSGTLAAAADRALQLLDVDTARIAPSVDEAEFSQTLDGLDGEARLARGLFTGGTLCTEAALILEGAVDTIRSNVGIGQPVSKPRSPTGHALVDFGGDELTTGRPHPMIDPTARTEALKATLRDGAVGVILVDVVLGYGAHDDPAGAVASAVSAAETNTVVLASVCGTNADPQNRQAQVERLVDAGVYVAESNAAAARLGAKAAARLEGESSWEGSA